jgi:hypothetical protein
MHKLVWIKLYALSWFSMKLQQMSAYKITPLFQNFDKLAVAYNMYMKHSLFSSI